MYALNQLLRYQRSGTSRGGLWALGCVSDAYWTCWTNTFSSLLSHSFSNLENSWQIWTTLSSCVPNIYEWRFEDISIACSLGQPMVHLSHWPGGATPAHFRWAEVTRAREKGEQICLKKALPKQGRSIIFAIAFLYSRWVPYLAKLKGHSIIPPKLQMHHPQTSGARRSIRKGPTCHPPASGTDAVEMKIKQHGYDAKNKDHGKRTSFFHMFFSYDLEKWKGVLWVTIDDFRLILTPTKTQRHGNKS